MPFSGSSAAGTRIDLLRILSWVRTSFPAHDCPGGKKGYSVFGAGTDGVEATNDFRLWAEVVGRGSGRGYKGYSLLLSVISERPGTPSPMPSDKQLEGSY